MSNKALITSVKFALSPARLGTFETAAGTADDEDLSALILYAWNAQVAAALLAPLHVCEVVIRNAVSEALETVYGPRWPWERVFEISLPDPPHGYNHRRDLLRTRGLPSTGKVIPELKFAFWQRMFTRRHDDRLWKPHLLRVLPNMNASKPLLQLRQEIFDDLEHVRVLRNRIAHHEPIFNRNLPDDFQRIRNLIHFRCSTTAIWMEINQQATTLIAAKP